MSRSKKKQKNLSNVRIALLVLIAVVIVAATIFIWKQQKKENTDSKKISKEEEYSPLDYVELGDYKNISVSLKVTKEDLQMEIDSLLEEHVIYEQLYGTVQDGDTVYADFEGYIGGQLMEVTCGSDYVAVGSGEWMEEFEEGILGAMTGTTVVFSVTVPEGTYGDPEVDGQTVEFYVNVNYICGEEIYPEYDDEFVQSISKKYNTTKEYNAHLKKRLRKDNEEQKAEFAWADVVDSCKVKKYPKQLLEESKQEVLQGYYDMADFYGGSKEEVFLSFGYDSEQEFIDSDLKSLAKGTAKEYLVAETIALTENIQYTPQEYQEVLEEEYSYREDEFATIKEYEEEYKSYIENRTTLDVVKKWVSENTEYIG